MRSPLEQEARPPWVGATEQWGSDLPAGSLDRVAFRVCEVRACEWSTSPWPPALDGHNTTLYRDATQRTLLYEKPLITM
jgi:hypothetical protein